MKDGQVVVLVTTLDGHLHCELTFGAIAACAESALFLQYSATTHALRSTKINQRRDARPPAGFCKSLPIRLVNL